MSVTPEGARKAQLSLSERAPVAHAVLSGAENISKYSKGVCHDVVAYTLYMRGAKISPDQLAGSAGQKWLETFNYSGGKNGTVIPQYLKEKPLVSTGLLIRLGSIQPLQQGTE